MSYILLIEDDQTIANIIVRLLSIEGYEVKHVLRGLEGMKVARDQIPILVLVDFDLPDIDGTTVVLSLKKQLGKQSPPIIAVTARVGEQEEYVARKFGCDAFVNKPFITDNLLNVIKQIMSANS